MIGPKGFTLVEAITAIMIISIIAGSIMLGISTVEKKLFRDLPLVEIYKWLSLSSYFLERHIFSQRGSLLA